MNYASVGCIWISLSQRYANLFRDHNGSPMQLVGLGDESRPRAAVHAPISVLPVPFPRDSFEKAKKAMQIFNTLIDRVSRDGAYLRSTLRAAAEYDDFTVSFTQTVASFLLLSHQLLFITKHHWQSACATVAISGSSIIDATSHPKTI